MNLEAINKWLDEEYGCSFTRLEELHNFYFERYCDLKQENEQLKDNWNKLKECLKDVMNSSDDKDFVETILDIMQELEQGSDSNGR